MDDEWMITRSILDGWIETNPNLSFGINGNFYVHQQRICHFLQGIWLIGNDKGYS